MREEIGAVVTPERVVRWHVVVTVMPKTGVNDPEGEAIRGGLRGLGFADLERARAGRCYVLTLRATSAAAAASVATQMAEQLLANPVIQQFTVDHVESIDEAR